MGNRLLYGVSILLVTVVFTACLKEEVPSRKLPVRIVFGSYLSSQSCFGSEACVEIFELRSGKLREDVMDGDIDPDHPYSGEFTLLRSANKYMDVEERFASSPIPEILFSIPDGEVGELFPWSTWFYLEYHTADESRFWIFDGSLSSVPAELSSFVQELAVTTSIASSP